MEALGNLNNALWSFHTRQETSRTVRTSWSIFRCLLFFDMIILMSGVALMVMALVNAGKYEELETMILGGASLGLFATVSAMCNSLACHGLRTWKKNFLLPWLAFYFLVLGFMSTFLLQTVYNKEFLLQKRHVFLFFLIFAIFYCWTHVKKQYLMMMLPRPEQASLITRNSCNQIILSTRVGVIAQKKRVKGWPCPLKPTKKKMSYIN